ncbi:unnamed protein product [Brachionus calyciflorus]|uniref:Uncharacterized protein n=1 Tax=Brachionus calyciflorus TaxID=104777 RepID=A0A813MTP4_9BILA|nr:unnamed protein product [Brachionus calyciflorus]
MNRVNLNLDLNDISLIKENLLNYNKKIKQNHHDHNEGIIKTVICDKKNVLYILGLFFVYNSMNLAYVSVSLGMISSLDIDPYLMFILNSLFEVLGSWFSIIGECFGRKRSFSLSIFIVGLCSLLVSLLPDDQNDADVKYYLICKVVLSLLSRFMQSTSYNLSLIYCINLFDVKIRSTVVLFLGSCGAITTLVAPQMNMLKSTWKHLPNYVNAGSSFLSCIILSFMPENHKGSFWKMRKQVK